MDPLIPLAGATVPIAGSVQEKRRACLRQLVLAEIHVQKRDAASAVLELEEFLKLHPDSEHTSNVRKVMLNLQAKRNPAAGWDN
jgi:hypothetical protein